jgi:ribosomal protein L19E
VLGSTEGKRSMQLHIEAHEWIQEIRVSLKKNNLFQDEENIDRSHYSTAMYNLESAAGRSYIAGMEVSRLSGLKAPNTTDPASLS